MDKNNEIYDFVIVGGGLSGLYLLYKLLKQNKQLRICLLESNNKLGGRIETIKFKDKSVKNKLCMIQYESGGARFSDLHIKLMKLLKLLYLDKDKIPIPSEVKFISHPKNKYSTFLDTNSECKIQNIDDFIDILKKYIKTHNISDNELRKYTLYSFTQKFIDREYNTDIKISNFIINFYEYWSELKILNAYDGLHLFDKEFSHKIQYYILKNGYISIINSLLEKITTLDKKNERHKIYLETYVKNFNKKTNFYKINYIGDKTSNNILCKHIVLAVSKNVLHNFNYLNKIPQFLKLKNAIKTEPLYRIYARYPIDKKTNKVWFHDLGKVSTNLKIKYIIPIDASKGLIMISYIDGKYARYWNNLNNKDLLTNPNRNNLNNLNNLNNKEKKINKKNNVETKLLEDLNKLFPEKNIPSPLWIKHHYWKHGSGYWLPNINSNKYIKLSVQPNKKENIYCIGSDFSHKQAWIEGCLTSCYNLLNYFKLNNIININVIKNTNILEGGTENLKNKKKLKKKIKKSKKNLTSEKVNNKKKNYSLEEVKKHNQKNDAWLIIKNKVYDVTKWIPNHPGGDIIMSGVGKDATDLFVNRGHSNNAKKILKTYYIGDLQK